MSERDLKADAEKPEADVRPFVAPCHDLAPTEAVQWLRAGWKDYRDAAAVSLFWGLFSFLLSAAITYSAWAAGGWVLLLSVLSGFIFVGPLLAFALYSVSRQLCLGLRPTLGQSLRAARKPFANSLVFALILLVIFLLWARAASMVHIFFPSDGPVRLEGLLVYLAVGSAVGSIFAAMCFAASVFSLPFIANRDVDVVTAVVSSINAVLRNPRTMLIWAICVVSLTALGFATAMLGFILVIPLLGYATWHGYRAALQVGDWPTLPLTESEERQAL